MISSIVKRYPNSLNERNILVCTHNTHATKIFLQNLVLLGVRVYYLPKSYRNDTVSKINKVTIINQNQIFSIIESIDVIVEDGHCVTELICKNTPSLKSTIYSIEQTTGGIKKAKDALLPYPVINMAESSLKTRIENKLATPESIISCLLSESSISLIGKNVLIIGYGHVGEGLAEVCKSHKSHVTIMDSDVIKRAIASAHGFTVVDDIRDVIQIQDVIISCTTSTDGKGIDVRQFLLMKNGAIVINAGSGTGEISKRMLTLGTFEFDDAHIEITRTGTLIQCNFSKAKLKKRIGIIGSAKPINLMCGNGTSTTIMEIVFSGILLTMIKTIPQELDGGICKLATNIETEIASIMLPNNNLVPYHISKDMLQEENRPWGKLYRFTSKHDLGNFSVVRAVFESNSTTRGHYHSTSEEAYLVESGEADIITWDPEQIKKQHTYHLKQGDYLTIPTKTAHKVIVTSDKSFSCFVIASPPFSFWDQFFPQKSELMKNG